MTTLRELREMTGLRQSEAARNMEVTQAAVARLERPGTNMRLDTLRKYVEQGLKLECDFVAQVGDKQLVIELGVVPEVTEATPNPVEVTEEQVIEDEDEDEDEDDLPFDEELNTNQVA